MTIVVMGGKDRIGSELIDKLTEHGHDSSERCNAPCGFIQAVATSPATVAALWIL